MSSKKTDTYNFNKEGDLQKNNPRVKSNHPNSIDPIEPESDIGSEEETSRNRDGLDSRTVNQFQTVEGTDARPPVIKIFLENLPKRASLVEIQNKLAAFGTLRYLRVPYSPQKRKNLGYGQVVFEDQELAKRLAQQKATFTIFDRVVNLSSFVSRNTKKKEFFQANPVKFDQIAHSRRAKNQSKGDLPPLIQRDISLLLESENIEEDVLGTRERSQFLSSRQEPAESCEAAISLFCSPVLRKHATT